MSVRDTINSIKQHIEDVYGIAEEKQASIPEHKNLENLADCVASITGGGGTEDLDAELEGYDNGLDRESSILNQLNEVMLNRGLPIRESTIQLKDINFFDYDGALLHSYTLKEFKYLDRLPSPPTHPGLTFNGWNWSLEGIKIENAPVDVGATYIPNDQTNRFYVHIEEILKFKIGITINGTATIDWGDGTTSQLVGTTIYASTYVLHEYYEPGDYVIKISSNDEMLLSGMSSQGTDLIRDENGGISQVLFNILEKIELYNIELGNASLSKCNALESIILNADCINTRDNIITSSGNIFFECYNLRCIIIPKGIYSLSEKFAYNCHSLKTFVFPEDMHYICENFFNFDYSLREVHIPKSVKYIANNAFSNCFGFKKMTIDLNAPREPQTSLFKENAFFANCHCLRTATLGNEPVGDNCLSGLKTLQKVILKNTVEYVGSYGFSGCTSLRLIDCTKCTSVPPLRNVNAFNGMTTYTIVVPDDLFDSWTEAANWSDANILPHIIKQSDYEGEYLTLSELPELLKIGNEQHITVELDFDGRTPAIRDKTLVLEATCSTTFFNFTYDIDYTNKKCYVTITNIVPTEEEYGVDSEITITLSNGADVSTSTTGTLKLLPLSAVYRVEDVPEASYKFELNANDYYESKNKGKDNTAALCKVTFRTNTGKLYVDCINYAESNYDFGLLSKIDTALGTSSSVDSSSLLQKNFTGQQSPNVQTVTYDIPDGDEHFIYIKFRKDGSVSSNYDTLQFKIRF